MFITNCNYRDFSLPVYKEEDTFYTILLGKRVNFVSRNWESEIKEIIDKYLDLILEIDKETWLAWFNNGDFKDIKLVYKTRILKIFLIQSELSDVSLKELLYKIILPESKKILSKVKKSEALKIKDSNKKNLLN